MKWFKIEEKLKKVDKLMMLLKELIINLTLINKNKKLKKEACKDKIEMS